MTGPVYSIASVIKRGLSVMLPLLVEIAFPVKRLWSFSHYRKRYINMTLLSNLVFLATVSVKLNEIFIVSDILSKIIILHDIILTF